MALFRGIKTDPSFPDQRDEVGERCRKGHIKLVAEFLCRLRSCLQQNKDTVLRQFVMDSIFHHFPDSFRVHLFAVNIFLFHKLRRLTHHPAYLLAFEGCLDRPQLSVRFFIYGKWAEITHLLDKLADKDRKTLPFAGRYPVKQESLLSDAHFVKQSANESYFPFRLDISGEIMTIAGMTSEDHDAIEAGTESPGNKSRINSARTHNPDGAGIGRVLETGDAGKVCARVSAPVAKEGQYLWFEAHGSIQLRDVLKLSFKFYVLRFKYLNR